MMMIETRGLCKAFGKHVVLDSIDLDTPQGHYTFTPQKHAGMPDSTNLMTVIKGGQFVPAGLSADQLANAGQ